MAKFEFDASQFETADFQQAIKDRPSWEEYVNKNYTSGEQITGIKTPYVVRLIEECNVKCSELEVATNDDMNVMDSSIKKFMNHSKHFEDELDKIESSEGSNRSQVRNINNQITAFQTEVYNKLYEKLRMAQHLKFSVSQILNFYKLRIAKYGVVLCENITSLKPNYETPDLDVNYDNALKLVKQVEDEIAKFDKGIDLEGIL